MTSGSNQRIKKPRRSAGFKVRLLELISSRLAPRSATHTRDTARQLSRKYLCVLTGLAKTDLLALTGSGSGYLYQPHNFLPRGEQQLLG